MPRFHDIRLVGDLQRHIRVLFVEKHGDTFVVDRADNFENILHHQRRKTQRRLIHHDQPRAAHQCTSDRQHLLFTAGKRARLLPMSLLQAGEQTVHVVNIVIQLVMAKIRADFQIFQHRQVREHASALRHEGDSLGDDFVGRQTENILGLSPDKIVAKGITLVPEGRRVFPNLTVLENLKIGAYLRHDKLDDDIDYVYSLFPRLKERHWQQAGTLSGGEQQMLAVGRALMSRPRLIMMDEPSLGLAPLVVQDIFKIIRTINNEGITVLLNEQNANMALKIADEAYVMETGHITLSGTGAELLANEQVKEAYLGKSKAAK